MKRRAYHLYFSLPTDLANEMGDWPEFVSSQEYSVDRKSSTETVSVRYVEDGEEHYVSVSGEARGHFLIEFLVESFTLWPPTATI